MIEMNFLYEKQAAIEFASKGTQEGKRACSSLWYDVVLMSKQNLTLPNAFDGTGIIESDWSCGQCLEKILVGETTIRQSHVKWDKSSEKYTLIAIPPSLPSPSPPLAFSLSLSQVGSLKKIGGLLQFCTNR